jgi:flagellum-specific peptidoglycan hydrolase FlgJ
MKILFAITFGAALNGLLFNTTLGTKGYTPQTQEEMIQLLAKRCNTDTIAMRKILQTAQDVQYMHGVPAAVTMTVLLVESDGLQSQVKRMANNCMGITKSFDWRGPVYCKKHREYDKVNKRYTETDVCFRAYPSIEDSIHDFGVFLTHQKRWWFADINDCPGFDYECWFIALAGSENEPGYASDYLAWKDNCMRVLKAYNLKLADI